MVDIETLGTSPDAAIISLGMAAFNDSELIATAGLAIRPADWHGDIDPSTVHWWMQQSAEARMFSFNGTGTAADAALQLHHFIQQYGGEETWANDPSFDIVKLRQWWGRQNLAAPFPIHYRTERSLRTIIALAKELHIVLPGSAGTAHNPIDDAANQARTVLAARTGLRAGRIY
jgi:hypothetical protein